MDEIHFTPMQKRIISYRMDEKTRVEMAGLENCSCTTIDRELRDIKDKIKIAIDKNLIVF